MKKRILFVLALFFMLTGFYGEDRIIEQNVYLQVSSGEGIAPSFTQKPVIRHSNNGTTLTIEVRIIANPKPTVTWWRNGSVLKESTNLKMFVKHIGDDTYAAVLEINNVTEEDAGRYKVVAKNEFGETTAGNEVSFDNE